MPFLGVCSPWTHPRRDSSEEELIQGETLPRGDSSEVGLTQDRQSGDSSNEGLIRRTYKKDSAEGTHSKIFI